MSLYNLRQFFTEGRPTDSDSVNSLVKRDLASLSSAELMAMSQGARELTHLIDAEYAARDEDDDCPVGDPDCMGRADECHDACEPPEPEVARIHEDSCLQDATCNCFGPEVRL